MRRIVFWLASTVTIVVLLFGYHTSTDKTTSAVGPEQRDQLASTSSSPAPTHAAPPEHHSAPRPRPTPVTSPRPAGAGPGPDHRAQRQDHQGHRPAAAERQSRETEINDQALPILINDTISAQSANIDMVSGATVTSDGYVQSLQAALDQAGR